MSFLAKWPAYMNRKLLASVILLNLVTALSAASEATPTFERDIRPILIKRCVVCHSARNREDLEVSGGLALDSYESVMKGVTDHKIVIAGKPSASALFTRLSETDDERRMPLLDVPVGALQRDIIGLWIKEGAPQGTPVRAAVDGQSRPARRKVTRLLDTSILLPPTPLRRTQLEVRLKIGPLPVVSSLAISDDGTTVIVGTYGQITVWNVPKREVVRIIDDLPGAVLALAFSPDGKTFAAGAGLPARSGLARIYQISDGSTVQTFEGHNDVIAGLAFRPDGNQLATASYDTTVRFWDLGHDKAQGVFKGHSDFVYDVAYLPDGKSVLTSSKDRSIKRIDSAKATELATYGEHNDDVLAVAVRPDGSGFVSSGLEPAVRLWTLDAAKSSKRVGVHNGPVHQLVFSRDGSRIASASGDKSIRVFNGSTGAHLRLLPGPTDWQYAVAISKDGKRVAGGGGEGIVRVWDGESSTLESAFIQPPAVSAGQPSWLAIDSDGRINGSADLLDAVRWVVHGSEVKTWPPLPKKP